MLSRRVLIVAAVVAIGMLAGTQRVEARRLAIAEPLPAPPAAKAAGDCCTPPPVCCPKPCISYRHCGPKLCCGPCEPPVQTVLKVKDPCTCCEIEVPLCIPACCKGEPTLCCGRGFLGRSTVEYEWCCGYRVRVAFKRCGDLIVSTWGR